MTLGSVVSPNEVPWLKNVLFTENGASYDTLLSYLYCRNFAKCWINVPARPSASKFQPDLEHESETIHQFPAVGQIPFKLVPFAELSDGFPAYDQSGNGSIDWILVPPYSSYPNFYSAFLLANISTQPAPELSPSF